MNNNKKIAKLVPLRAYKAKLHCPLCGASVPARGLRPKVTLKPDEQDWELVFTCPSCGLWSTFTVNNLSVERIESIRGSGWANKLRHFNELRRASAIRYEHPAEPFHILSVFTISFLTWMALIGNLRPLEVIWGIAVSLIVARLTYRFVAFSLPRWVWQPNRWWFFLDLMVEFLRQLIVQNVSLSIRVLQPKMPLRPGIVVVPTTLKDDISLTILGALMSMTPDTVTIDIDQKRGLIYVHWIDVKTTDPLEAQKLISSGLENRIIRWLN
jgi:multicomponent Na+:H+ antiporter subunit E